MRAQKLKNDLWWATYQRPWARYAAFTLVGALAASSGFWGGLLVNMFVSDAFCMRGMPSACKQVDIMGHVDQWSRPWFKETGVFMALYACYKAAKATGFGIDIEQLAHRRIAKSNKLSNTFIGYAMLWNALKYTTLSVIAYQGASMILCTDFVTDFCAKNDMDGYSNWWHDNGYKDLGVLGFKAFFFTGLILGVGRGLMRSTGWLLEGPKMPESTPQARTDGGAAPPRDYEALDGDEHGHDSGLKA